MSRRAVEKFVLGDDSPGIERKFVADRAVGIRIIISLCTSRGCLLVGKPGTAKFWLSELLTTAISGSSTLALQDALLSVFSDRVVVVPEIPGDDGVILAREGFNLVATPNRLDAGVHEVSAALKRRMDFEEIRPIKNLPDEIGVVLREVSKFNKRAGHGRSRIGCPC